MGTQELAHGGIEGHQATLQGDLAVATLVGRWRRRRGQSAQTKHGDVVIDLDAWVRAIPASLCALIVAGERAPIRPERSQKFIAAPAFRLVVPSRKGRGFFFFSARAQTAFGGSIFVGVTSTKRGDKARGPAW